MRHEPNKAIIFRSENFLQLSPLSDDILRITEEKGNTKIAYDIKVECGQHYYGPECAVFCNPNIGSFHFKCSTDGQRLCQDGWSGQNCDDPICANGCVNGYCVSPGTCKCRNGWQGENCDRCKVQEGCKHGYCNKANECICEKNWGGTYCDRDLDYCFHNSPCLNGGRCSSGGYQNYYYCNCTRGFTGQNCEIKLDPCANVNCGVFGHCIVSWNTDSNYKCLCDDTYYGDHCQYSSKKWDDDKIIQSESCKLSDSEFMQSGFSWTTVDCRHCVCQKGVITCSEKRCEPRDCYRNDSNSGKPVICPSDQHCVIVSDDECLRDICVFPRGRCMAWAQIDNGMAKSICRERLANKNVYMLQGCARIYLEFDIDNLVPGTTVGDVCFQLLLDINSANITHIGFDCKLITRNIVQVDIISLQFLSDVLMAKEYLKNRIRNGLSASQALAAVTEITDYYENNEHHNWNERFLNEMTTVAPGKDSMHLTTRQMLGVIICLMLLIIMILLNICILKHPYLLCIIRKRCGKLQLKNDPLELQPQHTHVYTMQPLIKNEKTKSSRPWDLKNHQTIPRINHPTFNKMKNSNSFDSGVYDREIEENEHNARIQNQRQMKSEKQILDATPTKNPILSPISLHLTNFSSQPLVSNLNVENGNGFL